MLPFPLGNRAEAGFTIMHLASGRPLSLPEFIERWQGSRLSERSAAQQHYLDLCAVLGQPTPAAADQEGTFYTFEKGVHKTGGGEGFADVWLRGHFAWEYKRQRANLAAAYRQLLTYREDLENPPLLVVCDLDRFEVHTNFTNTVTKVYAFTLANLARGEAVPGSALSPLAVLRALFEDPERLRPQQTTAQVTEAAASEFAALAVSLQRVGVDPEPAAHFLMRLLFCLFAQDIGLLPSRLFTRLVEGARARPEGFGPRLRELFGAMAMGGYFGADDIAHFNGGLFADDAAPELSRDDLAVLGRCCRLNWASVEPAIFGTLFERSLDPSKRAQLGAHYTSREDILLIVEPVLMASLRREWTNIQEQSAALIGRRDGATGAARTRHQDALRRLLLGYSARLASVRILDPACGSGNFLDVALKQLLDLEKAAITFAAKSGLTTWFPQVKPEQLFGIEVSPYAHELAQVVVWIGYLQWLHDNGFATVSGTILRRLDNIKEQDAIMAYDEQRRPSQTPWPEADIIIGNPPFLGGNKIRQGLGDAYVGSLFRLYEGRVPAFADLVCYWFERAREQIAKGNARCAGLLATQGIRGGANRKVLERIKESGDVFWAESDRNWILDGATVHVSMVGFDDGSRTTRTLDGQPVTCINADLTAAVDLTTAIKLVENQDICFMGPSPKAPFDIDAAVAKGLLDAPSNINGRPNSDVVRPVASAVDLVQRNRGKWTIDFGLLSLEQAAQYELPFQYVKMHVYPVRTEGRRAIYAGDWWQYARPRGEMRRALEGKARFIATPAVAKHRLFVWVKSAVLCNQGTLVFARDDDYFLGVLHSRTHELWARGTGTQLREAESGFRYTPTSTFETFPFPWVPRKEPADDPCVEAITQAARDLMSSRDRWLNPPGASESELKRRTLTNLYNERPTWLDLAHRKLDAAVFDAYGWPRDLTDEQVLERLLALNLERAKVGDAAPTPDVSSRGFLAYAATPGNAAAEHHT